MLLFSLVPNETWNYSGPCSSPVFVFGGPVASVGRLAFSERPTRGV